MAQFALLAAFLLSLVPWIAESQRPSIQNDVYFREHFDVERPLYGFANRFPQDGWRVEHLSGGGWNGSGAPHIVMLAGETQYRFGYETGSLKRVFRMGDGVYLRFRIKYDSTMRDLENWGNKFFLMGRTRTTPNSRVVVHMQTVNGSHGCSLGMQDYSQPRSPVYSWASPQHFGIRGHSSFEDRALKPYSWSLAPYVNIGWDCAPPIFQTVPENPMKSRPGPNSAVPVNGWYHVQMYVQSGAPGNGMFKVWANNNAFDMPTSERVGLPEGLGVVDWSDGAIVGGFMDNDTPSIDLGYVLDDFEIGSQFDPAWYPTASSSSGSR